MHLLFICTGNICRSPLAERLASAYADQLQIPDLDVSSAGIRAVIGHPIHPDSAAVLQQLGGDAANFAARQLTLKVASNADLILTMTRAQRNAVLEVAPRQLHRTFTLCGAADLVSAFDARSVDDLAALRPRLNANESLDIPDPIGRNPRFHAEIGSQIAKLLPPIIEFCQNYAARDTD
ncbi:low molecular weight phosphatase family protein [Mycolicibacterium holsaticum]|uniref:arsenate reductase/protein-tyrosine-phosphatase family protein n=1 Tax=Mycolicibacterium holsaticum TaxID=152142 RepID=UPI000A01ED9B|nr:low molecular weight phosphatase family protein [Mycolicibacterium holsaticum]